ncbi:MAG: biotin synthase BioB [Pseudomonadota bacterium]
MVGQGTVPGESGGKKDIRHDWTEGEAKAIYDMPFNDLLFRAQSLHRRYFDPNKVQKSRLMNIKTGGCPEDCGYCSQSAHHKTSLPASKLLQIEGVVAEATAAKRSGATRYCMGAAWRNPKERDMRALCEMVSRVKALGLETCMTLGMLSDDQTMRLKGAGLDYYNHNIDTSERYYKEVITTRTYQDRLDTLARVRAAGMKVCCGGIIGMGEVALDRAEMLRTLANLPEHPESVPVNMLVAIPGTPLEDTPPLDPIEFVRTIATARILMPRSFVRLSAGRREMDEATQALCYFAGANSIFVGDRLLTTDNTEAEADEALLAKLGIEDLPLEQISGEAEAVSTAAE